MTGIKSGRPRNVCIISENQELGQQLCSVMEDRPVHVPAPDTPTEDLVQQVTSLRPAVVIIDLSFQGDSGLQLIRRLSAERSSPPILALGLEDDDHAARARRSVIAGATGYLAGDEFPERLPHAVQQIRSGNIFLSDDTRDKLYSRTVVEG